MIPVYAPGETEASVQAFKEQTARKVRSLRCPKHHQAPRLQFQGATLQEMSIRMSACCDALMALANQKIAEH